MPQRGILELAEIADFFGFRPARIPYIFWSMVWLEHSETTRALEEPNLLFGIAKLERCGFLEVEATSFLCRAGKSRQP